MKTKFYILFVLSVLLVQHSVAQDIDALGTYTPYSLYGIGDLSHSSTAFNKAMGGIGVAVRDESFVNPLNVASLTQRDTLAFMFNVGLVNKNSYLKDKATTSAFNTFNVNNLTISFPLKNKTAMMIGLSPYSSIGYKYKSFEEDPALVLNYGDIEYKKYGNGEVNQAFIGIATNLLKNLSIGVEGIYYFGNLNYHSDIYYQSTPSIRTIKTGWKRKTSGFSAEFGGQYTYSMPKEYTLVLGATYRMKSNIRGNLERYAYAGDDVVMEDGNKSKITVPAKLTVGATLRKGEKYMIGLDYERQDWSKTHFLNTTGVAFSSQTAQSLRAGIEYIPNKYDVRYYMKRVTYRAGIHLDQSYVKLDGTSVNGFGITFGMSFPLNSLHNALNFSVDFGQRGKNSGNLVRERYVNFIFSFNLHDIWFIKRKYD